MGRCMRYILPLGLSITVYFIDLHNHTGLFGVRYVLYLLGVNKIT